MEKLAQIPASVEPERPREKRMNSSKLIERLIGDLNSKNAERSIYSAIHQTWPRVTPAIADEIAQEVRLKALKSFPTFRAEQTKLTSWLHRLAHNAAIDAIRKESRHAKTLNLDDVVVADATSYHDKSINLSTLGKHISTLPPRLRAVAEMLVQGYSRVDIAAALGIKQATVNSALNKIQARFRKTAETRKSGVGDDA